MSRTLYKVAITLWVVLLAVAILVGGFGAMLDDLLAGAYALLVLQLAGVLISRL